MKTLYFDCFSGISGDMTIAALIDLGVDFGYLQTEIAKLPVDGYRLESSRVVRANISAAKFDVLIAKDPDRGLPRSGHAHPHPDDDARHSHDHGPGHAHDHTHDHREHHDVDDHSHSRASEILDMISTSTLAPGARKRALAIFQRLAVSEGRVHQMPPEDVTFHEVGAIDSIVDIVGTAVGLEALGAEQFLCSPINVGGGFIQCQHGVYPVPAPATSNLLTGAPVYSKHAEAELVTPTGAAILAATIDRFAPFGPMTLDKIGYGAGTKDLGAFPNCLRLFLGEQEAVAVESDQVVVIEANIDDMSAEELAWASEKLMSAGALDVLTLPAQMKKGRPGHVLQVMGRPDQEAELTRIVFSETSTIGLRVQHVGRRVLPREHVEVETDHGKIALKIARQNGHVLNVSPEYEDCARIARETGAPFHRVREDAIRRYLDNPSPDRSENNG